MKSYTDAWIDIPMEDPPRPLDRPTGLVMAGGGARGAYEAGVLLYVLDALPRRHMIEARFDTFAGTSVGALNTSFLAARAHRPDRSARDLAEYWRNVSMSKVLRFGTRELANTWELLLGSGALPGLARKARPRTQGVHLPVAGVFDTRPLHDEMHKVIPWDRLQRNIRQKVLRGVALCATEVCTGRAMVFYQTADGVEFKPPRDPTKRVLPVWLGADHAMASAAIPFVFPSIQIDGTCYVDGGLHLNTPLFPILRLGVERLMVVSLFTHPRDRFKIARLGCRKNPYPGAVFLLGRLLGSFMDQALDHEIDRLEMFNKLIDTGNHVVGDGFSRDMDQVTRSFRNDTYRPIRCLHLRPSRSLNDVAMEVLKEAPDEMMLPGPVGRALHQVLISTPFLESELTSYIMFTPTYARRLVDLGYNDARDQEEKIVEFFRD